MFTYLVNVEINSTNKFSNLWCVLLLTLQLSPRAFCNAVLTSFPCLFGAPNVITAGMYPLGIAAWASSFIVLLPLLVSSVVSLFSSAFSWVV